VILIKYYVFLLYQSFLNRLFKLQFEKEDLSYEEKRALELADLLKNVDYLLDIHSTIKPSISFVYCKNTKKHIQIAKIFNTEYIVSNAIKNAEKIMNNAVDNFVDRNGGIGITLETGWHKDISKFDKIYKNVLKFLHYIEEKEFSLKLNKSIKHLRLEKAIIARSARFKFIKNYNNFEYIKKGEIYAKDQSVVFKENKDFQIIFPKKVFEKNKVAAYVARFLWFFCITIPNPRPPEGIF